MSTPDGGRSAAGAPGSISERLVVALVLLGMGGTLALAGISSQPPPDLTLPMEPRAPLLAAMWERFGPADAESAALSTPVPAGLPSAGWARGFALAWAALCGVAVIGAAARRRAALAMILGGCALGLVALWLDASGRWSGRVVVGAESPVGETTDPQGGARRLPFLLRLAPSGAVSQPRLVATFSAVPADLGPAELAVSLPARPGEALTLWPGPGQTRVEIVEATVGRTIQSRREGHGPPALHVRWRGGGDRDRGAWVVAGAGAVTDPEGRFDIVLTAEDAAPSTASPTLLARRGRDGKLRAQICDGGACIEALAPGVALPQVVVVGGVALEIAEFLPDGSQPVASVLPGEDGGEAVRVEVVAAEGSWQRWLAVDDPDSVLFTDGARIALTLPSSSTTSAGSILEILDDGGALGTLPLDGRVHRLGATTLAMERRFRPDLVDLVVVHRPGVGLGVVGVASILAGCVAQLVAWARARRRRVGGS